MSIQQGMGLETEPDLTEVRTRAVEDWNRNRRKNSILRVVLAASIPVAVLVLWQLASMVGWIDQRFFPSPSTILAEAAAQVSSGDLLRDLGRDIWVSFVRMASGFAFGAVAGLLLGTLMGTIRRVQETFGPMVYAFYPMPKLAILPLLLVIFGLGEASKIVLVALGVFYVVCISTLSGTLYSAQIYRDVAQAFAFPRWLRYRYVTVPAALPAIMNGIKLGIGQALILVVSVEFVSAQDGLGHFIWQSWQIFDIPRMFVGLFCIAAAGALAVLGGDALERKMVPWASR